jgi:hypothetical protein
LLIWTSPINSEWTTLYLQDPYLHLSVPSYFPINKPYTKLHMGVQLTSVTSLP